MYQYNFNHLTLSASDTGSGVSQMRFSNDNSTWSPWEAYGASKAWALTPGIGTKTAYVQYRNNVGNSSGSLSDTILLVSKLITPSEGMIGTEITVTGSGFGAKREKSWSGLLLSRFLNGPIRLSDVS